MRKVLIASVCVLCGTNAVAGSFTGVVAGIVAPDSRPCAFFSIAGVTEADPVKPGWPWIAVQQSQNGFKEIYALLLSAKLSGTPIHVDTNGAATPECDGYVGAQHIYFPPP